MRRRLKSAKASATCKLRGSKHQNKESKVPYVTLGIWKWDAGDNAEFSKLSRKKKRKSSVRGSSKAKSKIDPVWDSTNCSIKKTKRNTTSEISIEPKSENISDPSETPDCSNLQSTPERIGKRKKSKSKELMTQMDEDKNFNISTGKSKTNSTKKLTAQTFEMIDSSSVRITRSTVKKRIDLTEKLFHKEVDEGLNLTNTELAVTWRHIIYGRYSNPLRSEILHKKTRLKISSENDWGRLVPPSFNELQSSNQEKSKSDQSSDECSKLKSGERNAGSQTSAQIAKQLQTESIRQNKKALKKGCDFGNPNITRGEIDLSESKPSSSSNKHKNYNFEPNKDYTVEVSELEADSHVGCTAQNSNESTADKSQLSSQVEKKSEGLKCNEVGNFNPMDKSELQLRISFKSSTTIGDKIAEQPEFLSERKDFKSIVRSIKQPTKIRQTETSLNCQELRHGLPNFQNI
ncbi:hypothetical protein ACTXT7_007252 [Hymenolepis weldensis]